MSTDEPRGAGAPTEEDERHDDLEFNPQLEPSKAQAWLNLLLESEDVFEDWHDHCDKIDRMYASLSRLGLRSRDREFQMLWANCEVIKPSIYAKAPVPVVVPKFKDRRPVHQAASEVMERCATVAFDLAHIDEIMRLIRDDIVMRGRGVVWCRYEGGGDGYYDHEKVCVDYKHRRDFLHSVSRNWQEVTWVAAASYLTRAEARERFHKYSGDEYQEADYKVNRDSKEVGGADDRERAKFWEIWDRPTERVVWVAEGCENILDEDDAHMELPDFFPCPQPAYGSCQPGSLIPVPDPMQYDDQMAEINLLTAKIHALSDALEAKGFYPAGGAELSEAIQSAISVKTPGRMLVPISNWAAFGGSKEVIVWLPIDMIANTITALVALRKQVIDDVYQITGLSDIMRGATDPGETLGAQQLKSQFGSSRIRDKQNEMVRLARDLVRIVCAIITEKFDEVTIIEMSQTQLPTQAMQKKQVRDLQQDLANKQRAIEKIRQLPQFEQMKQQNPEQIQQGEQQAQALLDEGNKAIRKIMEEPTIDQVFAFFKDNRIRSFVLDIETDSTVMVDERQEKESRAEFIGVLSQLIPQLVQMVGAAPETAAFCGEVLKFATAPYRAGRAMDGSIDELAELMKQKGEQPRGADPVTMQAQTAKEIEAMKIEHLKERDKMEATLKTAEMQMRNQHEQAKIQSNERIKGAELAARGQDDEARMRQTNMKAMADREKHQMDVIKKSEDVKIAGQKAQMAMALQQSKMAAQQQSADQRRAMDQQKAAQRGFMP